MTYHKYATSEIGLKILREHLLKFSQRSVLNDPFESIPFMVEFFSDDQLLPLIEEAAHDSDIVDHFIDKQLTEKYYELIPNAPLPMSLQPWLQYGRPRLRSVFDQQVRDAKRELGEIAKELLNAKRDSNRYQAEQLLQDALCMNVGILSLSSVCHDQLLRAH